MTFKTQRDCMRHLANRHGKDDDAIIRAYESNEINGQVLRRSNKQEISPEQYTAALLDDGKRKGWLPDYLTALVWKM